MSHRASGSSYHRLVQCGYWARLDVPVIEREPGASALLGTEVHSGIDHIVKGVTPELPYTFEACSYILQAGKWLESVDKPHASEIAIVYDAANDTARLVEPKGPREYGPIGPMEIPTTLDLVWVYPDYVQVTDAKSGSRSHTHREQLVLQGLAAARLFNKPEARVNFLWVRKTKCEADPLEVLDANALDAEAWRAASTLRRLPMAEPVKGDGCWFCPAKPACPAHNNREQEMTT